MNLLRSFSTIVFTAEKGEVLLQRKLKENKRIFFFKEFKIPWITVRVFK